MVEKQRRTKQRQRRAGPEASRRIRTSRLPPRPRGGSAGALKVGAWSPVVLARPLLAPVPEPQPAAAPEPWGHGITCPGRGRKGGGGIERSRRAPRHRAVIERSAGPPLSRLLAAHAAIHSFIRRSLHQPTHLSLQTRVRPIVGPLDCRLLSQGPHRRVTPGALHCLLLVSLLHSPQPQPTLPHSDRSVLVRERGKAHPTISITLGFFAVQ